MGHFLSVYFFSIMSSLRIRNVGATVKDTDMLGKPDPIAVFKVSGQTQATAEQKNTTNPRWAEEFVFSIANPSVERLEITVQDKDLFSKEVIGTGSIALRDLQFGESRKSIPLTSKKGPAGSIDMTLIAEGTGWGGAAGHASYGPPVARPAHAASSFSDRDALSHSFGTYRQSYEAIVAFFEREDRLLSEEKLQFEEWKLAEQQLINQQSAELMRKQQEVRQYEADLLQFQRAIEASEQEIQEHMQLFEQQKADFAAQRARDLQHAELQQRALEDQQRHIAEQAQALDERRAAQQQLQQQQQQSMLQQQQQQMFAQNFGNR
eukprot:TRINITY_DN6605_c0_g1_i1.p1 TRINITY_DN6605_c0_g1~~TRINITY_DN6605_c0_g1_i1.p1  ORF type:complete len:321 (+),score=103.57 TRINITY_DN6605_c0_g1_i1:3-965(+)